MPRPFGVENASTPPGPSSARMRRSAPSRSSRCSITYQSVMPSTRRAGIAAALEPFERQAGCRQRQYLPHVLDGIRGHVDAEARPSRAFCSAERNGP